MYIKYLHLKNFRKFQDKKIFLNPLLNIIIGKNSQGKTTIIEALNILLTNTGFRDSKDEELIQFGKESAEIIAEFIEENNSDILSLKIIKNKGKVFYLNRAPKKYYQIHNLFPKVVLFTPSDIEIISGAPEKRRKLINTILSNHDLKYKKSLLNYENALKKRNKILQTTESLEELEGSLKFWDEYLENNAKIIQSLRKNFINYANSHSDFFKFEFKIEYLPNEITKEKLKAIREEEFKRKRTLIGPQKDDFKIYLKKENNWIEIKSFGSRSEQRIALLWLKKQEIHFLTNKYKPILLIDDIFSELDMENRKIISKFFLYNQSIVTTPSLIIPEIIDVPYHLIKL